MLEVKGPGGERASLIVEFKSRLEPKDVPPLAHQLRAYVEAFGKGAVPLVVAPFISPSTRERLTEAGLPFADPTGNLRRFVKLVERHWDGILAFCDKKVSLGYIESSNLKARNVIRRAYGYRDTKYMKLKVIQACTPLSSVGMVVSLVA